MRSPTKRLARISGSNKKNVHEIAVAFYEPPDPEPSYYTVLSVGIVKLRPIEDGEKR
jgi:hypothetical protein